MESLKRLLARFPITSMIPRSCLNGESVSKETIFSQSLLTVRAFYGVLLSKEYVMIIKVSGFQNYEIHRSAFDCVD